jgi:predicted dithiol-disulfide oxidoreductase (DUF899 family)
MSIRHLPGESPEYRKLRDELLEAEIELKEQRERVAELRRKLPGDTPIENHRFRSIRLGPTAGDAVCDRSLAELFARPDQPLVLMHFMYGGKQEQFCPLCTMWADGYDGVVPHLEQNMNFSVVVAGDVGEFCNYGCSRGWRNLRLLSSGGTSFKSDLGFEDADGGQLPGVSVFALDPEGAPRHFYSACAMMGGGHFRGMDLLSPVWNFLDLTADGRGEWWPSREYGDAGSPR